jgi:uncharacterized protein YecE (DUF72 family)
MVGCSGWSYEHWKGPFYPEDLPRKKWFSFYAQTFDTVEINNTFYNLPAEKTFQSWADKAGPDFVYSVKANRYITHVKRLKDVEEALPRFLERARLLERHLGPVLYQLPPNWRCDIRRLDAFLRQLPDDLIHVFEFRDQRWLNENVFALLKEKGASLCVHDMGDMRVPRMAIGQVAYVRFHGHAGKYAGKYPEQSLRPWADWLKSEADRKRDIYAYFNNDESAYAIQDALTLRRKLLGSARFNRPANPCLGVGGK